MEILFEDSSIIVCVKPVGIISQSDSSGGESVISLLQNHTGAEIFPLHRLDRETGGVMVYAKTKAAAAKLSRDIVERRFCKEYLAMIHGVPEKTEDTLCDLLFKDSRKNKSYVVSRERKGVKQAKLLYYLKDKKQIGGEWYSLIEVKLFTGRTHQIRVQFSHRKMPLAGDKKYGARDTFCELGLWSYKLEFTHPETHERLSFTSPPQNIISEHFFKEL